MVACIFAQAACFKNVRVNFAEFEIVCAGCALYRGGANFEEFEFCTGCVLTIIQWGFDRIFDLV
jgi:hypothetical protein